MGAEGTVCQRGEIPGQGFVVAAVQGVVEVRFRAVEKVDGCLQGCVVAPGVEKLAEPVDGKALRIELLLVFQRFPFGRYRPLHPALFRVDEMLQEPAGGVAGGFQVVGLACLRCRSRKSPDDTGIQDHAAGGVRVQRTRPVHFSVEAAAGVP